MTYNLRVLYLYTISIEKTETETSFRGKDTFDAYCIWAVLLRSMADGVENAAVVCCFMTPDYEKSENCKLELQYAQKRHKRIIPCMLSDTKVWKPSDWLGLITTELVYEDFHDVSELNIHLKARELIRRIYNNYVIFLYLNHLKTFFLLLCLKLILN